MLEKYQPEKCSCCQQTTTYLLGLDRGSVDILLDLLKAITAKGVNEIHPAREMDMTGKKKWHLTNLSRPRFHGLIAHIKDKRGYYCLTRKAGQFLRGKPIAQYAIISKAEKHNVGYWLPEKYQVTLKEMLRTDELPYWEAAESMMIEYLDPAEENGQQDLFRQQVPETNKNLCLQTIYTN